MINNNIQCMFFDHRFEKKPQGKQCGWVQKNIKKVNISIEDLADALTNGASFKPAVLVDGNKAENWCQQQLFALDFDNGTQVEEAYNKVAELGIKPCFMYTTFSHSEDYHKFRMVFCNDTVITDMNLRDKLQATLMGAIGGIDEVCFNRDRLFFGGKGKAVIHADYEARIHAEDIIKHYWTNDFNRYISSTNHKRTKVLKEHNNKNRTDKTKYTKEHIAFKDNTDAISTLNVELMQERLSIKNDKLNTDKRTYSLLVLNQSHDSENNDSIYQFPSESQMYQYINTINLYEYLGVPQGLFRCILPTHEDKNPSAGIYTTDDGTQIYKCFGCNVSRTIISVTEQLANCKRSEAINFIKKVYRIDYKPSEWVEQQRQLMIDSALYLDSTEFRETFPLINKLIRTRKSDLQAMLLHMTKHINEGLQHNGKPLFFVSLSNLMQICNTKDKTKMSQSITLFTLLNLINKVDMNCVPEDISEKAKQISAKYGLKKLVNFYQFEEYGYTTLKNSEKIAGILLDNNITFKGLSREYILRTFGTEVADKVYPQYKFENKQGTSKKADNLSLDLSFTVLNAIKTQGYMFERDININGTIGTQWKKSIQEILDSYGLKKIKLNKELKEKYNITCSGYPCVIIEDK